MTEPTNTQPITRKGGDNRVVKYCQYCGKELEQLSFNLSGMVKYVPSYKKCDCDGQKKADELELKEQKRLLELQKAQKLKEKELKAEEKRKALIQELIGQSGLHKKALTRTFDNFQLGFASQDAAQKCREYVDNFHNIRETEKNGLFIAGPCGVGKSHLAYAIANDLIKKHNIDVVCATMIELLFKLKESFKDNDKEILNLYKNCSLLIIDDLGKERPSEWVASKIYEIIDARANNIKPTIVTTNYVSEDLIKKMTPNEDDLTARATVDRLYETCEYIAIDGESLRGRL